MLTLIKFKDKWLSRNETGVSYVYTQKGQYIEKIDFNQAYWEKIKSNLVWFYEKCLVAAQNESAQHMKILTVHQCTVCLKTVARTHKRYAKCYYL